MKRRLEEINLAALLDGELQDEEQAAALRDLLAADAGLNSELEEQAMVKEALASLSGYEAPSFMTTRVLGEIASRRQSQSQPRWRPALAWMGGAAAMLLGFGSTVALMTPRVMQSTAPMLAQRGPLGSSQGLSLASDGAAAPAPGMFLEVKYAEPQWQELELPSAQTDERIAGFLRFANEAHAYRQQLRGGGGAAASSMTDAVLVLDSDRRQLLHLANGD